MYVLLPNIHDNLEWCWEDIIIFSSLDMGIQTIKWTGRNI